MSCGLAIVLNESPSAASREITSFRLLFSIEEYSSLKFSFLHRNTSRIGTGACFKCIEHRLLGCSKTYPKLILKAKLLLVLCVSNSSNWLQHRYKNLFLKVCTEMSLSVSFMSMRTFDICYQIFGYAFFMGKTESNRVFTSDLIVDPDNTSAGNTEAKLSFPLAIFETISPGISASELHQLCQHEAHLHLRRNLIIVILIICNIFNQHRELIVGTIHRRRLSEFYEPYRAEFTLLSLKDAQ